MFVARLALEVSCLNLSFVAFLMRSSRSASKKGFEVFGLVEFFGSLPLVRQKLLPLIYFFFPFLATSNRPQQLHYYIRHFLYFYSLYHCCCILFLVFTCNTFPFLSVKPAITNNNKPR
jgi:hypothetical protein